MSTHDTAKSLKAELAESRRKYDSVTMPLKYGAPIAEARLICDRAIARLALLERGIERADKEWCVIDTWRDADSPDFRSSLLALIEELGME